MVTFLLRFQEAVAPAQPMVNALRSRLGNVASRPELKPAELAATKTFTEVKKEAPDADPGAGAFSVLPL